MANQRASWAWAALFGLGLWLTLGVGHASADYQAPCDSSFSDQRDSHFSDDWGGSSCSALPQCNTGGSSLSSCNSGGQDCPLIWTRSTSADCSPASCQPWCQPPSCEPRSCHPVPEPAS